MKLTVRQVFEVTPLLATIIKENRPMPLKGAYRLSRMHAKLFAEFQPIGVKYDEIVAAHGEFNKDDGRWHVAQDKVAEFNAKWAEVADETIEVDVQPVPLALLDLGELVAGPITALELAKLGDLVTDGDPPST